MTHGHFESTFSKYAFGRGGGGHKKEYAVYARENDDNYGRPLTTYGRSSFSNEVGTCYCLQIRYLIVNGVFKRTILHVRNFRTDNYNSGTSHLISMLFQ